MPNSLCSGFWSFSHICSRWIPAWYRFCKGGNVITRSRLCFKSWDAWCFWRTTWNWPSLQRAVSSEKPTRIKISHHHLLSLKMLLSAVLESNKRWFMIFQNLQWIILLFFHAQESSKIIWIAYLFVLTGGITCRKILVISQKCVFKEMLKHCCQLW